MNFTDHTKEANSKSSYKNAKPAFFQPKLTINQPKDEYEQEADAMADKVMHIPDASTNYNLFFKSPISLIQRKCSHCEEEERREREEEESQGLSEKIPEMYAFESNTPLSDENKNIQRKCAACDKEEILQQRKEDDTAVDNETSAIVKDATRDSGSRLDKVTRNFFEQRFGYDFSNVEIHTGSNATKASQKINAQAYTYGNHIAFNQNKYAPATSEGKNLLAHELTHVVQQKSVSTVQKQDNLNTVSNAEDNASARFIVEDNVTPGTGQMAKIAFLGLLQSEVCQTVDYALAGTAYSSGNCPYIQAAFARYQNSSAARLENVLIRYQPLASFANNAVDFIRQVNVRVLASVTRWRQTRDISDVPQDLLTELPSNLRAYANYAVSGAASAAGGLFFKARPEASPVRQSPIAVMQQLGKGNPIDSITRHKMENAFGADFSNVKIHTDSKASGLSGSMNARAFTVGNHIAFSGGEHQPGTLVGDALMAHELAHVIQQKGGLEEVQQKNEHNDVNRLETHPGEAAGNAIMKTWNNVQPENAGTDIQPQKGIAGETLLEDDADVSAVQAVLSMWAGLKGGLKEIHKKAMPRLRAGLKLQRCVAAPAAGVLALEGAAVGTGAAVGGTAAATTLTIGGVAVTDIAIGGGLIVGGGLLLESDSPRPTPSQAATTAALAAATITIGGTAYTTAAEAVEAAKAAGRAAAAAAATAAAAKIAECEAIHAFYSAMPDCARCLRTDTPAVRAAKILCIETMLALRYLYLSKGCDYVLPGSIARGSQAAADGHWQQVAQLTQMLGACATLPTI